MLMSELSKKLEKEKMLLVSGILVNRFAVVCCCLLLLPVSRFVVR